MISAVELAALLGLDEPTPEQAAVIESGLDPAVVIAGAGSGKTETMAARVVWLVANGRVAPEAVLGLTFTRKAAAELGKRIRRRLAQWRHVVERENPDDREHLASLRAGEPTVSTYAAYAGRLVSEQALRIGVEPDARLLSQALSWQLADTTVRRYDGALPGDVGAPSSLTRYLLTMAGQFADHLVQPDQVQQFCEGLLEQLAVAAAGRNLPKTGPIADLATSTAHRAALVQLVRDFAAQKAARAVVDFGDQMRIAARLAEIGEVRGLERSRFAAVLLDEYQDTGHAQIAMLHGLFGDGHPVTAVGDPFQSIYGWRGAGAGNIGRFAQKFRRADGTEAIVYPLATSFRNDRVILYAANTVAAPLRRLDKLAIALRPAERAGRGSIAVARVETVEDEARWLADRMSADWEALPAGARTAAVLVRRRAQIPLLSAALQAVGLPVEVVGLGGLLTTPEVVDVAATLRVLGDHQPARSLVRLLTGARWRIGPYDLAALRNRAAWLVRVEHDAASDQREPASIVEALDDLGPSDRYSAEGYRRLAELCDELRRLRRRLSAPLAELVAEVERTIGVDVEVAARADRAAVGRAHLDRFLDEAARFATESDEATLRAFLAFLDAAEDEENGLEAGEIVVEAERVQVLTVHGAKGLEWDVVAVPGLVEKIFPAEPRSVNWTRARQELPGLLRGDGEDLPLVTLDGVSDLADVRRRLERHHDELIERHAREERRLAYVALTRARSVLIASGFAWDNTKTQREPSRFLVELLQFGPADEWFEPEPGATNPMMAEAVTGPWPADPLGPRDGSRGRRPAVEAGAALVRAAAEAGLAAEQFAAPPGPAAQWRHDVDVLLAERARLQRGDTVDVELPRQLSVSQLVELDRAPQQLARRLHRPLPMPPAPWARRGTAFHAWLEQRWQAQTLLDVDELPGAADADADDTDLLALRAAFEASDWANRTPAEVEVPFEMAIDGTVVRGRMDAVFGSTADGWLVVDWKTGRRPTGAAARAAAVQLGVYRLAWARLCGIADDDLHKVRAAFHYVRSNETVQPADLLDAGGLRALVTGPPGSAAGTDASVAVMTDVRAFVDEHRHELLADLDQWLRIPGISAQPEHHDDVRRSADWFAAAARTAGFPSVEIWPTAGLPAVYAEWRSADAGAPTVLVYGHHDVQPVDPIELWHTDPFDPTIDGDLLHARGASDDKGQLLFHLLGLRAHLAATGRDTPAVTLKFLIEGEEESGSPNFETLLAEQRARLDCDVVVITDTGMIAADKPSTVTGMRGLVACTVHFHGPDLDLHSGSFGGAVPNPATAIARLAAALHDEHGRIQVAGFYDDVIELSAAERELFAKVPVDDAAFLGVAKSRALSGERGFTTLERIGARPTAEVNGIGGGYQGSGGKTIVPSDAFVKLSFRLVAGQNPKTIIKAVEAFVADHTPEGIAARIDWAGEGVAPCLVPLDTPAYRALCDAISQAFDGLPVLPTREGGSGPEATIQRALGAPMVFLGVGLPDDQIHAPNEKVNLSMLEKGAEAAALLWDGLARLGRSGLRP